MPSAKLALAAGLAAVSLAACGSTAKPEAGTLKAAHNTQKGIDDPRVKHLQCLHQDHISATPIMVTGLHGSQVDGIQVGSYPQGPRIVFEATAGIAQGDQIQGTEQSAEVIGTALLYPDAGSDGLLQKVEDCVAEGVQG
jgi:hypothetical protein